MAWEKTRAGQKNHNGMGSAIRSRSRHMMLGVLLVILAGDRCSALPAVGGAGMALRRLALAPIKRYRRTHYDEGGAPIVHRGEGMPPAAPGGSAVAGSAADVGVFKLATCVALIAASAIGGSFLALPMTTQPLGFLPSALCMTVCWFYLLLQGMVVAELSLRAMKISARPVVSMHTIGYLSGGGKLASWLGGLWVLLQWSCLVAQVSRAGSLLSRACASFGLPHSASCGLVTLAFYVLVFGISGQRRAGLVAEGANNLMTVSFLGAMVCLISLGMGEAEPSRLLRADWRVSTIVSMAPLTMQIMMYIQTVPTVCAMLQGYRSLVMLAVFLGSFVPYAVCLLWSGVGIAMVPMEVAIHNADPIDYLLSRGHGSGLIKNAAIVVACTAIGTTIVGIYLIIAQYFDDIFTRTSGKRRDPASVEVSQSPSSTASGEAREAQASASRAWRRRLLAVMCTILPPLLGAAGGERMYMAALLFAGNYPVTIIWGILPPLLLWRMRRLPLGPPQHRSRKSLAYVARQKSLALLKGVVGLVLCLSRFPVLVCFAL